MCQQKFFFVFLFLAMFVVVRTPFFRKHPLYDGSNPACVPAGSWVFRLVEGAAHWPDLCPLTSSTPTITACSKWSSTWVCHWRGTSQSCCSVWLFTRLSPPFLVFTNCLSDEMHLYWLIEWLGVTLSDPPCLPDQLHYTSRKLSLLGNLFAIFYILIN